MSGLITVVWWLGGIAGIIDAAIHPSSDWVMADRNKAFWIVLMIFLGVFGTAIYLLAVRPRFGSATDNPFRK